jgi:hypothetical protein
MIMPLSISEQVISVIKQFYSMRGWFNVQESINHYGRLIYCYDDYN